MVLSQNLLLEIKLIKNIYTLITSTRAAQNTQTSQYVFIVFINT